MKTVEDILKTKGHSVIAVSPDATVYEALKLMADRNIGAVVVLDGDRLAGIFSERDYARKVILVGKSSKETRVKEIMTEKVVCVRPPQTCEECMALMTSLHVRHLPVIRDDRVTGVVSIGDVVKETISEQKFIIQQLENFITR